MTLISARFFSSLPLKTSLLALTAVMGLSACGKPANDSAPSAATENKGQVNVYTARHYDADALIYDAFTKETGIKVNRLEIQPDQLVERMKAEGEGSPADVILMADAGALWKASQADLFQPLQSDVINKAVPANLREPGHLWFGFSKRARVIVYDKAKVKPEEVATYEALATPRFKGKVCVRSSDNVYNLSLMAAFVQHWGPKKSLDWAKGVVANMARDPQGGDMDQIKAVSVGACEVALSNTYYYMRLLHHEGEIDPKVAQTTALSFPDVAGQGTHVNISGGGMAKYATNKKEAQAFLEFMTTKTAQTIFAKANGEFPVIPSEETPSYIQAISGFKADPLSVTTYGANQAEAQKIYDKAGWK